MPLGYESEYINARLKHAFPVDDSSLLPKIDENKTESNKHTVPS